MTEPTEEDQPAPLTEEQVELGMAVFECFKQAGEEVTHFASSATWEDQGDGQRVYARTAELLRDTRGWITA